MYQKTRGVKKKSAAAGGGNGAQEVFRHIPIIQVLGKVRARDGAQGRRLCARILELSPSTVRAMGNISLNALNQRVPMSARQKREFEKHLPQFQALASAKTSQTGKRKVIQEGGILPLITAILPAVASLIGAAIGPR